MAHENMRDPKYWYGDEDVTAVVDYVGKNTPSTSDNTQVIILGVVNGQDSVSSTDPRSIQQRLSKAYRKPGENLLFRALSELVQDENIWKLEESKRKENIKVLLQKYGKGAKQTKDDERFKQSIDKTLEETHYNREELREYLAEQEKDPFDQIAAVWHTAGTENLPFRILFPVNLGKKFNAAEANSGSHWVLGEFGLKKNGGQVTVTIPNHDSLGRQFSASFHKAMKDVLKKRLQDELGFEVIVAFPKDAAPSPRTQDDGSSCGPITCDNLELRAQGKEIPKEKVAAGAQELRQKQYNMVTDKKVTVTSTQKVAEKGGIWDERDQQKLQKAFEEVFHNVHDVKLKDRTVETTDLTDKNLEEFVKSTKTLMQKLDFDGEVEVSAPADKKQKLIDLCKTYGIKLAGDAKPAPAVAKSAPVVDKPERMVDIEESALRRGPGATAGK